MTASINTKTSIVLVHGAFADASGWQKIILALQDKGYAVTAVQVPLRSLADDVATTVRALESQNGDVVLVGHSYGGAIITGASAASTKVKALVYVAAFAPDQGETLGALLESQAPSSLTPAIVPDSAGFLYIDRSKFRVVFAADVTDSESAVMAATQKPISGAIFGEPSGAAGWKNIPSWFIVAKQDHAINPDLERFFAKRMKATTVELDSSHVPFLSQPDAVVKIIEEAAKSLTK
jgi:pimeloyl-ACP methyl ester carboxylesterase